MNEEDGSIRLSSFANGSTSKNVEKEPTCANEDIEIVINAKGEVTFEVKGVKGGSCLAETKFLENALGGPGAIVDQQKTGEFYEQSEGYASVWTGEAKGRSKLVKGLA